jgi:hypothetical protein
VNWEKMRENRAQLPASAKARLGLTYDFAAIQRLNDTEGRPSPRKGPYMVLERPYTYTVETTGESAHLATVPLFTATMKMACASFSLPAGPMESGGTCPASLETSVRKVARTQPEVASQFADAPPHPDTGRPFYICDACYAGKGNYQRVPLNAIRQSIRLAWVKHALAAGLFVPQMIKAIAYMRALTPLRAFHGAFFRIHDSGDFYSKDYYAAWVEICTHFTIKSGPETNYVAFWAPTRMWVLPAWRETFRRLPPPPNLSLRPSALFFGGDPPDLTDESLDRAGKPRRILAGGSTSSTDPLGSLAQAEYSRRMRARPDQIWDCPAYDADETSKKNCQSQGCRVCWVRRDVPVSYREH